MAMRFWPLARPMARTAAGDPTRAPWPCRSGFRHRNPAERLPRLELERGSATAERHVELAAGAGKVLAKLLGRLSQDRMVPGTMRFRRVRRSSRSSVSSARRSTNSSSSSPASPPMASIGPSGVSIHVGGQQHRLARASWRVAEDPRERGAEAAVGIEAGVQARVERRRAVVQRLHCGAEPACALVGLECHPELAFERAAHLHRIESAHAQVMVAKRRRALRDLVQQRREPVRCARPRTSDRRRGTADSRGAGLPGSSEANSTFSGFGFRARQVGRQKIPVVLTHAKNRPSKD